MNKEFKEWLSKQKYTYYIYQVVNDDTSDDWCIKLDTVVEGMAKYSTLAWEDIIKRTKHYESKI